MSTQPFAPEALSDAPRQHPNLAPGVTIGPALRTSRVRAGVAEARGRARSSLGGDPTPNAGYAFTLAGKRSLNWNLTADEHRADAVAVVAEIAIRRATGKHRAPTGADVEFAETLLGYLLPPSSAFEWRPLVTAGAAHHYQHRRFVVDSIPNNLLSMELKDLASHTERIRQAFASIVGRHSGG